MVQFKPRGWKTVNSKPVDPHTPEERADWLVHHFRNGWSGAITDRQFLVYHLRTIRAEALREARRNLTSVDGNGMFGLTATTVKAAAEKSGCQSKNDY